MSASRGRHKREKESFERTDLDRLFSTSTSFLTLSLSISVPHSRSSFAAQGKLAVSRVWSRSEVASNALADALSPRPVPTFGGEVEEDGKDGGALGEVLRSADVDAVLLVLPVQAMPSVARAALRAGKAVLQEKPVAGTVTGALESLAVAREVAAEAAAAAAGEAAVLPVFALAENYRSEPGVLAAAAAARGFSSGDTDATNKNNVTTVSLVGNMPMNALNRYHGSAWRRDAAGCPGCFLMDSSVHFVAALRSVASAAGLGEPTRVGARATRRCGDGNDLPAPDTLTSWVEFGGGGGGKGEEEGGDGGGGGTLTTGTVSVTFAGAAPRFALTLDTRAGAVELSRGGYGGTATGRGAGYTVAVSPAAAGGSAETSFHPFGGLEAELESFLRLARGKGTRDDARALSPASATRDLALIEAMLSSSAGGGVPTAVAEVGGNGAVAVDPLEGGFGVAQSQ